MPHPTARIETKAIKDWDTFHTVFAQSMGFPDFYGRNMDAWIDCMSHMDGAMTRHSLEPGEIFLLEITHTEDFSKRLPEIFQALIECTAFVNDRFVSHKEFRILALVLL